MERPQLERAVRDPGFTPSVRDIGALVDLLANDDLTKLAERAIARANATALETLCLRFDQASPPLRGRILRVIGRLAEHGPARAVLVAALDDTDAKTRRNAAIALGHTRAQGVEEALLRVWDRDERTEMRRSIAASLGKIGSSRSLPVLREASRAKDARLSVIAERAVAIIARTESRGERGRLDSERVPSRPVDVEVFARSGIEQLLAEELAVAKAVTHVTIVRKGCVRARLAGPMSALFAARTMLSLRFPLATESVRDGETMPEAVARAVTSEAAQRIFSTWTEGVVRYRIAWAAGGHKRAAAWETAHAIGRGPQELVNDPTLSLWELVVATTGRTVDVAIVPRALADPRFAWRRRDVPAASHPTIAAALARVAEVRADDVVWDPFVGSGAELIERAIAGPYASLEGTDIDADALASARENLQAAGVVALLEQKDALAHFPRGVTLVLTNPPMGRRASRTPRLADMLDRLVAHAAAVLSPGGRLVWIAPSPSRARAAAFGAGLALDWARVVDMGGFDAEIQRWTRRA
jgi:23S rRNA G2445 N2-methylase RlmL